MKITEEMLKNAGCCKKGIIKFRNTPELHDIPDNLNEIIVTDRDTYDDIKHLLDELKIMVTRIIKLEDSKGYWEKREYDDKGNELRYEDSAGRWEKHEYDDKGNKIKLENSGGEIINYQTQKYDITKIKFITNGEKNANT